MQMDGMVDGKTLKLSDLDLEFIATKAQNIQNKQNPERALVRHNWIEIFVRLCQTKYIKNGAGGLNVKNWQDCFSMMLKQNVLPLFKKYDCHAWRKSICWREEVDLALKQSLKALKEIYKKWSGRNNGVGVAKFMSLSEFTDLLTDVNVYNDDFGQKQVAA